MTVITIAALVGVLVSMFYIRDQRRKTDIACRDAKLAADRAVAAARRVDAGNPSAVVTALPFNLEGPSDPRLSALGPGLRDDVRFADWPLTTVWLDRTDELGGPGDVR